MRGRTRTPDRLVAAAAAALVAALGLSSGVSAQEIARGPVAMPERWLQGFVRPVSGEHLVYPWAYPGQVSALLSRATDGSMVVEWEGEAPRPPEPDAPDEPITWLWHAGFASGYGAHRFTLHVNGTLHATFTSGRDTNDREWTVTGDFGATLAFKSTRVGTFNELFGFMMLTLPCDVAGTGPPRFTIVPEAAGSRDYYMTFQHEVRSWVRAVPVEAVLAGGRRAVRLDISHVSNAAPVIARSGDDAFWSDTVGPGYTSQLLRAPPAAPAASVSLPLIVEIAGQQVFSRTLEVGPVRPWQVHLLPHSHVDIGYSDPQPEVERKQWKNLADAVALARKTAAYPPEARFKWNVEGLWSVESYLGQADRDARQAFIAAVKEGSIGLQANYTNVLTGLSTPDELLHWTDSARRLAARYGLPVGRTAMHTDIPGLSWIVVAALAQAGVRYFSSGPNYMPGLPDRGDRIGHTLNALGDRPFWWASPSGQERLLFWMAGRGYSWFHGLNTGSVGRTTRDAVLDYLGELVSGQYPYELVQVRYTIGGDNGPVDPGLPGFVRAWNDAFEAPRLVLNTADALFAEFERRYGEKLPTLAGDMTPYWEDGAVSSAGEEATVRAAARRLVQAEALWSLRNPSGFPDEDDQEAWRQVTLWHEHTWGAADSVSQPERADVIGQWQYKRAFAVEADRRSNALLEAAMPAPPKPPPPRPPTSRLAPAPTTIEIVNTLAWPRGGLAVLPKPISVPGDLVRDTRGRPLATQRLSDGRLAVRVDEIQASSALRFTVNAGSGVAPKDPVQVEDLALDNGRVRVEIDRETGDIRSLRWAGSSGTDLVAPRLGLNAWRYVPGRDPAQARSSGRPHVVVEARGPLVATLRIESDAPGTTALVRRVTLVAGSDDVSVETAIEKTSVRDKESAHVAFPFDVPGAIIRVDEGAALVELERGQLPGSCKDFIGAHSAVDVSNASLGISLVTLDAPLIEPGAITDERQAAGGVRTWREKVAPGSTLFAYLLNNYWHTNYKADQAGQMTFRFVLRPHGPFDPVALRRFSAEQEQPLLSYAVTPRAPLPRLPFRVSGAGVMVGSMRPLDRGRALLVRLYNASAEPSVARLQSTTAGRILRASVSDAAGATGDPIKGEVKLPAFASMLVRVELGTQPAAPRRD